jgi:hypothetical protein
MDPLFLYMLLFQAYVCRSQYASIDKGVMIWAKDPEHMPFINLQRPVRAVALMIGFMSQINNATFCAFLCFTTGREIGIFFIQSLNYCISITILRSSPFIIILHCIRIHLFEGMCMFFIAFNLAFGRTISSARATVIRHYKLLVAMLAYSWLFSPIRICLYRSLPLRPTCYGTIHLSIIVRNVFNTACRTFLNKFFAWNFYHKSSLFSSFNLLNKPLL